MTSSSAPTPEQKRVQESIQRRRRLTVFLLLLALLGYGLPRLGIWMASGLTFSLKQAPSSIYQSFRDREELLRSLKQWPGHAKVAKQAHLRLIFRTNRGLQVQRKRHPKHKHESLTYQSYVSPYWARSNRHYLVQLCRQRKRSRLQALDFPKQDLTRYVHQELSHLLRLMAGAHGDAASLIWLGQRQLQSRSKRKTRRKVRTDQALTEARLLAAAGAIPDALRALKQPSNGADDPRQRAFARCSFHAALSQDAQAALADPGSLCRAARAWQLLQRGQATRALDLIQSALSSPTTTLRPSLSLSAPLFFAAAAVFAQTKRWRTLQHLWKGFQQNGDQRRLNDFFDVFQIFNKIYMKPIPPALLTRLEAQLEAHRFEGQGRESGMASLLRCIRWMRARQALLFGHPERALRMHKRLIQAPNATITEKKSYIGFLELLRPAKVVWKAILTHTLQQALPYHYLTALLRDQKPKRAAAFVKHHGLTCEKAPRPYQALCQLIVTEVALQQKQQDVLDKVRRLHQSKRFRPAIHKLSEVRLAKADKRPTGRLSRVLFYPYLNHVGPRLRGRLLLMQRLDPTGALSRRTQWQWICSQSAQSLDGHLLLAYLREREAKGAARTKWAQTRRALGAMNQAMASLWLAPALLTKGTTHHR